jgi:serine/threonine protein kinase/WD40 repeat protein
MQESVIFKAALELPPGERAAYLDRACGDNAALRQEVEGLLRAHNAPGEFMDRPPVTDLTSEFRPEPERPGSLVGPYKLIQLLGEGGMGTVFLAQQTEPVKRPVALKIIKAGMDSKAVLARFEAERQALAMMDHPNIAKVLDAGATESGRPFFVMELVKGVPITKYCDDRKLTPRQRLELFVPVCQAIQHAHQKGIIHRDIKPSNVLVALYDDRPVPKVIDFGVAKATGPALTEHTLMTGVGGVVGTPEYMSPEQATLNNLDVDTRSDVYALGVLLYELLVGSPPFSRLELEKKGILEILRVVREDEPPRPSNKLSTADALPALSAKRSTEPGRLTRLLRSELDWIVMKSLEKERSRRYESANGFAQDVERYLAGEPVQAVPPSTTYRLRKFLRRNKGPVAAAGVVLLALVVGTVVSSWQAVRATRAEERADERTRKAEENEGLLRTERDRLRKVKDNLQHALYITRNNLLEKAWVANDNVQVHQLLEQQRPGPDERDLRGFEWYLRDRQAHQELRAFGGAAPDSLAWRRWPSFSPDMCSVCTSVGPGADKSDGGDAVYDLATGKLRARLAPGPKGEKRLTYWSPDSKHILTMRDQFATRDGSGPVESVSVYDPATGREQRRLALDLRGGLSGVSWSPDSKRIAVGTQIASANPKAKSDKTLECVVYDAGDGHEIYRLQRPANAASPPENTSQVSASPKFSPDGKYMTVDWMSINQVDRGYERGGVTVLYDATTGTTIRQFERICLDETLFIAGASADGRWIVAKVRDAAGAEPQKTSTIKVWSVTGGEQLSVPVPLATPRKLPPGFSDQSLREQRAVHSISRDGRFLTVVFTDSDVASPTNTVTTSTVAVWDIAGSREVQKFTITSETEHPGGNARVDFNTSGFDFSPDGKWLTESLDKKLKNIRLFDLMTGKLVASLPHTAPISLVKFSADGMRLVTASDSTVYVWDVPDAGVRATSPGLVLRHTSLVRSVEVHPDGEQLFTADWTGQVKAWDIRIRERPIIVVRAPSDPQLPVYPPLIEAFSANADRLAALDFGSTRTPVPRVESSVSVWDSAGKLLKTYQGPTLSPVPRSSPDAPPLPPPPRRSMAALALSPEGEQVAVVTPLGSSNKPEGSGLHVYATDTDQPYFEYQEPRARERGRPFGASSYQLAFSRDGKRLAWSFPCAGDKPNAPQVSAVKLFDLSTPTGARTIEVADGVVNSLAFSPDGTRLLGAVSLTQPNRTAVRNWDVLRGVELSNLEPVETDTQVETEIVTSHDGSRVAAVFTSRSIPAGFSGGVIWDAESGRRLFTLNRHARSFHCLGFSPDGRRIAVAVSEAPMYDPRSTTEAEVILYDTTTGDELMTLKDTGLGTITSLRFSPDGYRLHAVGRVGVGPNAKLAIRTWDATPRPDQPK